MDASDRLWQKVGVKRVWPVPRWLGVSVTLLLAACRHATPGGSKPNSRASVSALVSRTPAAPPSAPSATVRRSPVENDEPPEEAPSGQPEPGRFIVDELADVGPAGPASAASDGVVLITREGGALLARYKGPLPSGSKSGPTRLVPIDEPAASFSRTGAPPAVMGDAAYFVLRENLVRQRLGGQGAPEVLAPDAREGSRVVAPLAFAAQREPLRAVGYLSPAKERLVAKLWVEQGGVHELSPEGTSISSLALAQTDDGLMAVSLEGRTSMSPVHARRIRIEQGRVELDSDVVVWVGGTAQQLTELTAIRAPTGGVHVFLPLERDITHFGLARLEVDRQPRMDAEVWWRNYPNGIDPAPISVARICDDTVVVYARPQDPSPQALQELCLARVTEEGLGPAQVAARARRIATVSLAPLGRAALMSYVGDKRTWAATLRCRPGK